MMTGTAGTLAPVAGRARIDVLDITRGLAILGIYYMNVGFQATSGNAVSADLRLAGWTIADQRAATFMAVALEGTQRCLLEFLFGAGMMILTARAMKPDGPVAIADLYYRRTLWLIGFGLIDIFIVLWPGDILLVYGLAGLFLFPFRKLGPKMLVALGMACALFTAVTGGLRYADRAALVDRVQIAEARRQAHQPLRATDTTALAAWRTAAAKRPAHLPETRAGIAAEKKVHAEGDWWAYANLFWYVWVHLIWGEGGTVAMVFEAFCAMLIGVALWKWGVIQGQRSTRFYAAMMIACYAYGFPARAIGFFSWIADDMAPNSNWPLAEFTRLALGLGHLAFINLVMRSRIGAAILSPFKAAGRVAFSLYFLEQIIGLHILFSPYGFDLWGRFGWAGMFWVATLMYLGLLVVANVWTRYFAIGPMEWAWRSLAYMERQPFRKRPHDAPAPIASGILPA